MKKTRKTLFKSIIAGVFSLLICFASLTAVFADGKFTVSPMNQKIVLTPGETYKGSFKVGNPSSSTSNFPYKAEVTPFYVTEDYEPIYENNGDYTQIVDWIKLDKTEGEIAPNTSIDLQFEIKVPKDAPAGGQYAAISVTSNRDDGTVGDALNIEAKYSIAHLIYAEIAGTTKRQGEIFNANVPSFILDGNISGVSSVKNMGNVHGTATYTLQVFPLFSNEEVYTNEEKPMEKTILPDRTLTNSLEWDQTPFFGLFNVKYTVEFEGVTTEVTKLVIKCPLWMFAIFVVIIVGIVVWLVMRSRSRKKAAKNAENM